MERKAKYSHYDLLREKVTGFKGVVLGITYYATGCIHYGLASRTLDKDGSVGDWQWFDESRLGLVEKDVINCAQEQPTSGPDMNPSCY